MALHFDREELARRRERAARELEARGLDALLMFRQESTYYLTGYDTFGFVLFQCMVMTADGRLALLTRSADRLQAKITSVVEDVRIWRDGPDAAPAVELRDLVTELVGEGSRLGVEYDSFGLTGAACKQVEAAFAGVATLVDASDLVRDLRLVKSAAELEYVRSAGRLTDEARDVSLRACVPGADLGAIYGEMLRTIMAGGGDPPAGNWPLGCGEEALLVRYHTGLGTVGEPDQVTFEFSGAYRHYHTPAMHVVLTGRPDPGHRQMFEACRDALDACEAALRPGRTVGDLFETHARTLSAAGYGHAHLNACGYTMNANYAPSWMDTPMLHAGNPQVIEAGMVFFMHMILLDDRTGLSMSLGETSIVTDAGNEPVTHAPRELIVN